MKFFRKQLSPEVLGSLVYETLRSGMESAGELSVNSLIYSLDLSPEDLDEQYVGETMIALLFGATLAIESSASRQAAERIGAGMKTEFLSHIMEQGATQIQKAEWETIIAGRFLEYRRSIEDYSGFEPPWKLGRKFFWNIIGEEKYIAMSVKIATLYILAGRQACQAVLNEYGPSLLVHQRKHQP